MKPTFKLVNPSAMEAELTLRLPLAEWETMAEHMSQAGIMPSPVSSLYWAIMDVVRQAQVTFSTDEAKP